MLVRDPTADLCPHQACSVNGPSRWFQNCFLRLNLCICHGVQQAPHNPSVVPICYCLYPHIDLGESFLFQTSLSLWLAFDLVPRFLIFLSWFLRDIFATQNNPMEKKDSSLPQCSIMITQCDSSPLETGFMRSQSCHYVLSSGCGAKVVLQRKLPKAAISDRFIFIHSSIGNKCTFSKGTMGAATFQCLLSFCLRQPRLQGTELHPKHI